MVEVYEWIDGYQKKPTRIARHTEGDGQHLNTFCKNR